jgi:hypothetical protein
MRPDRGLRADAMRAEGERSRPPAPRRPAEPSRPLPRDADRARNAERRASSRPAETPPRERTVSPEQSGSRLRGIVAVLGVFLVTLAGGIVDWFVGVGLGTITLVALVTSTAIATLVVRRRDMVTVVLSPPLVFVAVAGLNVALSPSLALSIPTVATILIRGFPTMAVATACALILALVRLVTKR